MAQTMQAVFKYGNYGTVDYTPGSAVAAGAIIEIEDKVYIAHLDIAANVMGALAAHGGTYSVLATGGTDGDVIALGEKMYWDAGGAVASTSATSNMFLGYCARAKAATDDVVWVEHVSE